MKPIAAALAACLAISAPVCAQTTLLTGVTIVDVETGGLTEGATSS